MNEEYHQLESRLLDLMANPAQITEEVFNETALQVHRFQRRHNRPYNQYCQHLGCPVELQNWKEIPAVPQSAFKHSALRTFPEELTTNTFRTSGTTGEGYGQHHFYSTALYDAAILHGWDCFQLPRLRQVILTLTPEQAPYSSLSHMMGCLMARACGEQQRFCIRDDGSLDPQALQEAVAGDEPVLVMGTALAFLHLFESGVSLKLPNGSFAMETGGYKGQKRVLSKPELYAMFENHLGLEPDRVFNEYGMTELSSQFYTWGLGKPHLSPPWMKTLLINPETGKEVGSGETGMIRIFDLANLGSVLALETQDLGVCCGPETPNGFVLLGRDPAALPRGCSRSADEMLGAAAKD